MENNKENWEDIHRDFTPQLQQEWTDLGFTYEQTKEWAEVLEEKFKVNNFGFCAWLRDEKHLASQQVQQQNNLENLKTEYYKSWTDIHKDFGADRNRRVRAKYPLWEKNNLTYQDAQTWIATGLKPQEVGFIAWLKKEKHQPEQVKDDLTSFKLSWWQKTIYTNFTEELRTEWIKLWRNNEENAHQTAQGWISAGLEPQEAKFARWLENKDYITKEEQRDNKKLFQLTDKEALKQEYLNDKWASTIHPDFAEKEYFSKKTYQQHWEENNLTHQDAQEWISVGFKLSNYKEVKHWKEHKFNHQTTKEWKEALGENFAVDDWNFYSWLRDEKHLTFKEVQQQGDVEDLKIEYNKIWTSIHPDFATKKSDWETYQQEWEKEGLTYQDAQILISAGFEPYRYSEVKQWQNLDFTLQQTKSWRDVGLGKEDTEFATHLRKNNYNPTNAFKEKSHAQHWLDWKYPQDQRNTIQKLSIDNRNLTGSLDLSDFANLEELKCSSTEITTLNLDNCLKLKLLSCYNNNLTNLDLSNNLELKWLDIRNNNFNQDLSFLKGLVNLKELSLGNSSYASKINQNIYNRFKGSLEPLKNMSKLEELYIRDTDIDSGLEYLPDSVKRFDCLTSQRKDAKCKVIKEIYEHFDRDLKKAKEFNASREWLDKNYPENKKVINLGISYEAINRYEKQSKKITLKGGLWLKGLTDLKKLNCSGHQLTDLDLSDCPNLIELKCDDNEFKNLDFFKPLSKLQKLSLKNNPKLVAKNLDALSHLTNLKELDLSNCGKNLKGSLKSLESMKQLEKVSISQTNISEGLEYLPESCQELSCELDYDYNSVEIAKQLSKFSQGEGKYDLVKWRTDKANNTTASIVPLERLFVIRGNLKQFINKWNKPHDNDTYENFKNYLQENFLRKPKKEIGNELAELHSPNDSNEIKNDRRAIYSTQFIGRGFAVAGTVLTFQDQSAIGGGILAIYPFTELLVSKMDERLKNKENKWNEFLNDADSFSDNFNELLGITKSIKTGELGTINKEFRDLKEKINEFLKEYDSDGNREIDVEELKEKRTKLAQELNDDKESKLWKIIDAIKDLEDAVVAYRQDTSDSEIEKKMKVIRLFREIANDDEVFLKKLEDAIINFQKEISKLNTDKSLSIDTSNNTARTTIDKRVIEQFISNLEGTQIDWDNKDIEKAINNLQKEVDDYKQTKDKSANEQPAVTQENPASESWWAKGRKLICGAGVGGNAYLSPSRTNLLDKGVELDEIRVQNPSSWININPNFTSELIQKWQNLGFTAEQCRDWININSPNQQEPALQEPEFYAWLRDEIKLTPERLLNHSAIDFKALKEQFQKYQQIKEQVAQILQPAYGTPGSSGGNH